MNQAFPLLQEHGGAFLINILLDISTAVAQFLLQTELVNRAFLFVFFSFFFSWFEVQILFNSFLESIFTTGTNNCTISHYGV